MDMFNQICVVKEKSGNLYKYEVKNRRFDGESFLAYVPTVFVIKIIKNIGKPCGFPRKETGYESRKSYGDYGKGNLGYCE